MQKERLLLPLGQCCVKSHRSWPMLVVMVSNGFDGGKAGVLVGERHLAGVFQGCDRDSFLFDKTQNTLDAP